MPTAYQGWITIVVVFYISLGKGQILRDNYSEGKAPLNVA
jgi:hypothetical protein